MIPLNYNVCCLKVKRLSLLEDIITICYCFIYSHGIHVKRTASRNTCGGSYFRRDPDNVPGGIFMNIYLAFSLFSLIILLYWVIAEMFTILFRLAGLPDERARFQVISLLTGCGFTTRESEMILSSKARRRLARITMLFGYVFNITIVTAFINIFFSLKENQAGRYFTGILIPLAAAAVILLFIRVPMIKAWGDRVLERFARKLLRHDSTNTVLLIDYIGQASIAQVTLYEVPEEFRGLPLSETDLKTDRNILVMLVEKEGKSAEAAQAGTVFSDGDKVTVFGDYANICRTFKAREQF